MRLLRFNPQKRLWILCVVVSLLFHFAWLVSPLLLARICGHNRGENAKDHFARQSNSKDVLKLQIYSSHPTLANAASLSHKKYQENLNRPSRTYYKLFPRNSADVNVSQPSTTNEGATNHESAARAFVQSARSSPHVREFAAELRARLSVPDKIYHLRRTGHARALIKKISNKNWSVDIFGDDKYARAILLEAISAIPENSPGFLNLNQSDWRRIEVGFSFEWRNNDVAQPEQEAPDVSISENHITITVIHRGSELELNKNLRRAMLILPLQGGGRMVDIVGIYKEFLKNKEPAAEFDRGIRRLELSPAFMKSFITIPLGK